MSSAAVMKSQKSNPEYNKVAFDGPGTANLAPSAHRPLDLVHLARQTGGDRSLETEILQLFRQQVGLTSSQLRMASAKERKSLAHTLQGSAGAVGAFVLAAHAVQIEKTPSDSRLLATVDAEIARICDFIAGLSR